MKRLCGSGVIGQSELPRGELGKGGRPAGRGFGCLKLLLSEKSDWDSAAAPSKGERAVMSDMLMGTTRLGLVKPGGGEGESLVGIFIKKEKKKTRKKKMFVKLSLLLLIHTQIYIQTKEPQRLVNAILPVVKSRHLPCR